MAPDNGSTPEPRQQSFKQQLDQRAVGSRDKATEQQRPNAVVEKITEYMPVAAKILGGGSGPADPKAQVPGPPDRPDHDGKIEDFVRHQHRSKSRGGDLDPDRDLNADRHG